MRIWLDPDKLANLGITAVDVQNAIAEQNVQVAAGKIGQSPAPPGTSFEMQVNAVGRLSDPQEFGDIVVRADPASGAVVRLRDVARIELGALQYSSSAFFGKDPTVVLAIFQMPGSNALDLQKHVKTRWRSCRSASRQGIAYAMHYDTTRFVSAAMHDVVITLVEALAPRRRWSCSSSCRAGARRSSRRSPFPVSLIATLVVMQIFGFSLNMLSLLGMVLAIGLVVDDAIVVVENVERQLEAGLPPLEAARKAMTEVTGPIIATTAVLMAVFIPVAFIPGVAGPALQPVRADGRDLGRDLGLQLADAQPGAQRRLPAPRAERAVCSLPLVQHRLRLARERLCALRAAVHSLRLGAGRRLFSVRGRRLCAVADDPVDLPAGRGPGLFLRRRPVAGRSVARAHRRGGAEGARHPASDARRRDRRFHQRPQLSDQRGAVELGDRIRHSEAVERARAGAERVSVGRLGAPEAARDPGSLCAELRSAFDHGLGTTGGFEFQVEDLAGRGGASSTTRRRP